MTIKNSVFDFVMPIIGFNDLKQYALIDYKPDSPFKWLQSVEDMELAFPITLCSFFGIDYQFDIPDEEAEKLEIENADDVFVCNIANISNKSISTNIIICAFLLGFGGISIMLQILSITSKVKLSIKPYIIGKLLQAIFAAIYTYIFIYTIPVFNL